ncbi:MAG: NAD-dependent epimerase/dehydratase family protein [Phycisphaerae bacterium]
MNYLITGAGGFLGSVITRSIHGRNTVGDKIRTFQRGDYPALADPDIQIIRGDLTDLPALIQATRGIDIVFHVAAKAGVWGSYRDYYQANVLGTQNVIAACRHSGVRGLVFTSSPSVVFDGTDENGITESVPYPKHYLAYYPQTKALAERAVLAANAPGLRTVALRPHLIWGPNDPHLIPRILARARAGRLRLIGQQDKLVDSTYIDNAAHAHLIAADQLATNSHPACVGKAYFISNGEPLTMADLIGRILAAAGLPSTLPRIPARLAYLTGAALELTHTLLRLKHEPLLTRFVARQLSTAHWFDLSAARRDLGYHPLVTVDEGLRRLAESLRDPSNKSHP